MPSSRRKPDRLEGIAADQLIEALRTCRFTLRDLAADLRFETPAAHACRTVLAASDALAHLITGSPYYFHAQGTLGAPGEPNWQPGSVSAGELRWPA
jgi:hypothetical protein